MVLRGVRKQPQSLVISNVNFFFYQGRCVEDSCNKKYYAFYEENIIGNVVLRKFYKPQTYFSCTLESVFECKFLKQMTGFVTFGSTEMINLCDIYNLNNDNQTLGMISNSIVSNPILMD